MRVLLLGDIHGHWQRLSDYIISLKSMFRIESAIQVGDFGLYERNFVFAKEQELYFRVPLHVIDGNHENHRWISSSLEDGLASEWATLFNIHYHERSSVFSIDGTKIGVLGGALHVDRPQESSGNGRVTNFIQRAQTEAAIACFNQEKPDVIVTHTCPAGIGIGITSDQRFNQGIVDNIVNAGYTPSPLNDCGDWELQMLWQELRYRPRAWIFGHFHRDHEKIIDGTQFVCLPDPISFGHKSLVIWDTQEKSIYKVLI